MDSLDLLTSGTGFSGGRINHQFTCVLGESSWLLFPKSTCLFQVHTLYFNSFLSFCKLKSYMQDYVTLEHSKNTKGKLQTFILRYPSPWAEDLLASPESTPFPAHLFFLIFFSCSSLPGRILKHFLIGILCIITWKINSDSTTCTVPSLIITAFFLFGIPVVFAVWCLV